jgi:hypothetical protein
MSRSFKKVCGGAIFNGSSGGSDAWWRKMVHSTFRAKERDVLIFQMKHIDEDLVYPEYNEICDLWDAPSDGGTHFKYSGFESFYNNSGYRYWTEMPFVSKKEAWKFWVTRMIGK